MDREGRIKHPGAGQDYDLRIPVRFYPPGGLGNVEAPAEGAFVVAARETALVLMDTWNGGDPEEGQALPKTLGNIRSFLHECRRHGVTVIHAPNHPVVDRYPQYHAIKETVQKFMGDYPPATEAPPFLGWPPRQNDLQVKARQLREDAQLTPAEVTRKTLVQRDISRFLKPLEDEFVLASHHEFRYVLWKRKVKLLLYVGGALNECMQHRDTGINMLAGSDSQRTAFTIVVLEDCSSSKRTPRSGSAEISQAMLDYFMCKIAFVSSAKDVAFVAQGADGVPSDQTP